MKNVNEQDFVNKTIKIKNKLNEKLNDMNLKNVELAFNPFTKIGRIESHIIFVVHFELEDDEEFFRMSKDLDEKLTELETNDAVNQILKEIIKTMEERLEETEEIEDRETLIKFINLFENEII